MIQKAKNLFSSFGRATTLELAEQKKTKIANTQAYLQVRRTYATPTEPIGFKPRTSSAYFFSNFSNNR